jgi:hypothetical protein
MRRLSAARLALALALSSAGGCVAGFGAAAGPTLETTGHAGAEVMGEAFAGIGAESVRAYGRLALGGGYLGESSAGYALVQPGLGFEFGRETMSTIDVFASLRLLPSAETTLRVGGGIAFAVIFPVAETGGEDGHVGIGPRLALELVGGEDGEPDRALLSLSFAVRWTSFDTVGNRWF